MYLNCSEVFQVSADLPGQIKEILLCTLLSMSAYINKLSTIVETTIIVLKYKYIPAVPLLCIPLSLIDIKNCFFCKYLSFNFST